ncbi:unnamed protein product [Rotaria sordida]|nr:unnamed protein product [Rotaria sordida]
MTLTIYNGNNRTCVSNCNFNQHRYDPLNERCIAGSVKRNGDGFNEPRTCPQRRCTSTQLQYRYQNCTSISYVCDEIDDCSNNLDLFVMVYRQCSDGSDELNYDNRTCTHKQFTYNNGRCIASSHECDLDNDCGNNSDENPNQYLPCNNANHFRYNNEQCIPRSFQW